MSRDKLIRTCIVMNEGAERGKRGSWRYVVATIADFVVFHDRNAFLQVEVADAHCKATRIYKSFKCTTVGLVLIF